MFLLLAAYLVVYKKLSVIWTFCELQAHRFVLYLHSFARLPRLLLCCHVSHIHFEVFCSCICLPTFINLCWGLWQKRLVRSTKYMYTWRRVQRSLGQSWDWLCRNQLLYQPTWPGACDCHSGHNDTIDVGFLHIIALVITNILAERSPLQRQLLELRLHSLQFTAPPLPSLPQNLSLTPRRSVQCRLQLGPL